MIRNTVAIKPGEVAPVQLRPGRWRGAAAASGREGRSVEGLGADELELIGGYRKLNRLGRERTREYTRDCTENPKYTRSNIKIVPEGSAPCYLPEKLGVGVYSTNETMKMIGRGVHFKEALPGAAYEKAFDEVGEARGRETTCAAALDFFALGMICGIREERKRKRTGVRSWT